MLGAAHGQDLHLAASWQVSLMLEFITKWPLISARMLLLTMFKSGLGLSSGVCTSLIMHMVLVSMLCGLCIVLLYCSSWVPLACTPSSTGAGCLPENLPVSHYVYIPTVVC